MIRTSCVRLAAVIATAALAGCTAGSVDTAAPQWSTNGSSTTAEELPATPLTVPSEPLQATTQAFPPVQLPTGQVPPVLVGNWRGGVGAKTGEYLRISEDGFYERGVVGREPYRQGVIVASSTFLVTYDIDGTQQSAQWEYVESGGIEVLGITFNNGDYYSYVRV